MFLPIPYLHIGLITGSVGRVAFAHTNQALSWSQHFLLRMIRFLGSFVANGLQHVRRIPAVIMVSFFLLPQNTYQDINIVVTTIVPIEEFYLQPRALSEYYPLRG